MTREAWVAIPSEETVRAALPPGAKYPYDFGFLSTPQPKQPQAVGH